MRLSYIHRLFFYFILIFSTFTIIVILVERANERNYKKELIEKELNSYIDIIATGLRTNPVDSLERITTFFPKELRITIINQDGSVLFDNEVNHGTHLTNHFERPEIINARTTGQGEDIRRSSTLDMPFLYFVKRIQGRFIRVALPYNLKIKHDLKPNNLFLYSTLGLFLSLFVLLFFVMNRFNKSIKRLRDFIIYPEQQEFPLHFPNDELGEISRKITDQYLQLSRQKKAVDAEKEKLLQHVKSSKEGICFFTATGRASFYNELFIQYLNQISEVKIISPEAVLSNPTFYEFQKFLTNSEKRFWETRIDKQGFIFLMKVNVFEDKSFELILNDISEAEKADRIKRELTSNIAHELRTPVAKVRGYLETIIEQNPQEKEKAYFIRQAFRQSILLSDLINDMRLIAKMEEGQGSFKIELVNIATELNLVKDGLSKEIEEKQIDLSWNINDNLVIPGNTSLIYSLFRNLVDNSIKYGGVGIEIRIEMYREDPEFYYFSFSDSGVGIPDERHLPRIFERFYRIDEGRTRGSGGTGLGLSIVKNTVLFHHGNIVVKNKESGGLEFLFTLHK